MLVSVFILGILAMTAQAAFLREVLATFRGGELTIGAALLFWLFWTSIGSGILGRIVSRITNPEHWFHELLPWYGIFGYTGVLIIGNVPFLARLSPGELVPYDLQLIAVCAAFLPFNILGGFLFVLGSKAIKYKNAPSVGRAYIMEASGAAFAGVAISLIFVNIFSNHSIAMSCAIIGVSAGLIWKIRYTSFYSLFRFVFPLVLLATVYWGNKHVSDYYYKGQNVLGEMDTKYGRLRVTRKGEQITFYADASTLFSTPDLETSEYTVHIPMLASNEPHHVLVLGGGPGGIIDEVLKYKTVELISCVELDPGLFKLAEQHLKEDWADDPHVETVIADGRAYLEKTSKIYDVIVMNMPSPLSGVTNRYYTSEFFRLASSHLSRNGILGFSLISDENYISEDLAYFLSSIRATLATVFPSIVELPGLKCRFLAGNAPGMFGSLGWEQLSFKREKLGIETLYVRDYFLRYTMSPIRMDFIKKSLDAVKSPAINSDTRPTGYFTCTILQGNLDSSHITNAMKPLISPDILKLFMLFGILLISLFAVIPGKGVIRRPIAATVVSVGMTEISLEVLAIMAYQSIFGFLYGRIALLTGTYMAGLALGAWLGTQTIEKKSADIRHLIAVQLSIAGIPILWAGLLGIHSASPGQIPYIEPAFYILILLSGMAGGFQFPLADSLYRKSISYHESGLGVIYGVDLAGSSVGALVTASLMIPILGMIPVLVFLSALNFITAFALWLRRK